MEHTIHENHTHIHNEACGHTRIQHGDHIDYLHNGHLHSGHERHFDECVIPVGDKNPDACVALDCGCGHDGCGHQTVPHGDHTDYLVEGRLHHPHNGHCDDHGVLNIV